MARRSNSKQVSTHSGNDNQCVECDACCKYVSVEIDKPTTKSEIEDVKFYIYHEGSSVYIDEENDWYIMFESKCDKLGTDGQCTIYEERPTICREFAREDCHEHDLHESHKIAFCTVKDLMRYIKKARPVFYKKHYSSKANNRPKTKRR